MTKYITTRQVAEMLNRPVSTVVWQVVNGKLPVAMKLPGKNGAYLYHPADIRKIAADEGQVSA